MKLATFALLCAFLVSCGGNSPAQLLGGGGAGVPPPITLTSAQVFPNLTGQVKTFMDSYHNVMQISFEPAPISDYIPANSITLHYLPKNGCAGYWSIGTCQSELWFVLSPQPDGSWITTALNINFPQSCSFCNGWTQLTAEIVPITGLPPGYLIVPASASTGSKTTVDTAYLAFAETGFLSWDTIASPATNSGITPWRTDAYIEQVQTPVYSGPAMISEQWEGPCFPVATPSCAHEKWAFAPGLGLVQVIPIGYGQQGMPDPNLIMRRID